MVKPEEEKDELKEGNKMEQSRPRLTGKKLKAFRNLTKKENRVLIVGDLHCPFEHPDYFDFCVDIYESWNLNKVVFIGDIIDNHFSSYHENEFDADGGGKELSTAIKHLDKWKNQFPKADVIIGNHDRMIMRKAKTSSIPKAWIKSYNDVLGTKKWKWHDRLVIDGVQYVHGEGGTAKTRAKNDMMSTVQGHIHTQAECIWTVGNKSKIFGMQVGCGIDRDSFAMAYAKNYKKQAVGCGVVIGGHTAINFLMDL
jgi:hypothetical protein